MLKHAHIYCLVQQLINQRVPFNQAALVVNISSFRFNWGFCTDYHVITFLAYREKKFCLRVFVLKSKGSVLQLLLPSQSYLSEHTYIHIYIHAYIFGLNYNKNLPTLYTEKVTFSTLIKCHPIIIYLSTYVCNYVTDVNIYT